jgi:hypothetical protein
VEYDRKLHRYALASLNQAQNQAEYAADFLIALIVACLGSFRSLFQSNRSSKLSREEDILTIGHSGRPRVRRGSFAHIYGSSMLRSKVQPETIDMPSRMPSTESSVLEFLTENENIMHGRSGPGQPFERARVVH